MNRPAYPKYKPSGVDWLGEVPEHWEVLRSDGVIHSKSSQIAPEQFSDRDVFHYSIPNVQEYGTGAIEEGESIASAKQVISSRVVLVSKLNPRKATVCIAAPTELLTLCSGELVQLHAKHCHVTYLYYLCLNELFRQRLDATVQSVTRSHQRAYPHDIYRFWHAWPPLAEQRAIADFLDRETSRLDTLVGKKRELIARLKERRAALIARAVTRGLDPAAKLKDSGVAWLGMVPQGWDIVPLKYLCSLLKDGTHLPPSRVDDGFPLLSVRNISDGVFGLRDDDSMVSEESYKDLCRSFVPYENDVLLAIVGATIGKTALVPAGIGNFHIQRSLAIFRTQQHVRPKWLHLNFQSTGFQQALWQQVGYSAQPGIYLGTLSGFQIPIPSLNEQDTILAHLARETTKLDRLTASVEAAIERLQEYRAALITAAVTGKIDVREAYGKAG